jgi:2'-5' RNA ligase
VPLLSPDSTAFPVEPPGDLNDHKGITAHDQSAFDALDEMVDHWSRPGWSDGARAYYWMLAFRGVPELKDLAQHCQEALSPLRLDPVPTDWLHVTLVRVGAPGSVDTAQLHALAGRARALLPEMFTVQATPLAGSRGAVRLTLTPWEPLVRLHAALAAANASVGLPARKPTALFRPHLSLAYNNRPRPARPVIETAAGLRSLPSVELSVADVQLVELRRSGAEYRWDVLESLPLTLSELADRRSRA